MTASRTTIIKTKTTAKPPRMEKPTDLTGVVPYYERHSRHAVYDEEKGHVNVPAFYDSELGWYSWFRIGKNPARNIDAELEWKLGIDTFDEKSYITSIYQDQSQHYDPKTQRPHPLASPYSENWNDSLLYTSWNDAAPNKGRNYHKRYIMESQQYLENADEEVLPVYSVTEWRSNVLSADNITLDVRFFSFLVYQRHRDSFDGSLGLARVKAEEYVFQRSRGVDDIDVKRLQTNDSWFSYRAFALSFADEERACLQFGVNDTHGDISMYDGDFYRFHSNFGNNTYNETFWFIDASNITIGDDVLPMSDYDLENWSSRGIINITEARRFTDSQKLTYEGREDTISSHMALSSVSKWTRLHPCVTYELYTKIPRSEFFQGAWYLPCSFPPEYTLPEIKLRAKDIRGVTRNLTLIEQWDFVIVGYKHPNNENLCAGAIQSGTPADFSYSFFDVVTDGGHLGAGKGYKHPTVTPLHLGQSFFKRHYIHLASGSGPPDRIVGVGILSSQMRRGYGDPNPLAEVAKLPAH
ncbi:hypothetical protein TWF281_003858 [Arthrobotrys megalospora]